MDNKHPNFDHLYPRERIYEIRNGCSTMARIHLHGLHSRFSRDACNETSEITHLKTVSPREPANVLKLRRIRKRGRQSQRLQCESC